MSRAVVLIALVLAGCAKSQPVRTGGIVSTNPCADQLLVELAPHDRIAAISHYSQDPGATSIPLALARRFAATAGTAEEVIALKPDLVLASSFTPAPTLAAYDRAGLKVLMLDSPTTIAASRDQITSVAAALGTPDAGKNLIARIDRAVADADPCAQPPFTLSLSKGTGAPSTRASTSSALTVSCKARPATLLYISDNFANGGPSLLTEMIGLAGLRDMSAEYGLAFSGSVPIESVVARPPHLLLEPDPAARTARLRRKVLGLAGFKVIEARFPRQLINCGGPTIIDAMRTLAAIRKSAI